MRILLVEDEPDLGTALKNMLNQHNYVGIYGLGYRFDSNPRLEDSDE
jgi:hypothetical protein